jgi:hypothetical protein
VSKPRLLFHQARGRWTRLGPRAFFKDLAHGVLRIDGLQLRPPDTFQLRARAAPRIHPTPEECGIGFEGHPFDRNKSPHQDFHAGARSGQALQPDVEGQKSRFVPVGQRKQVGVGDLLAAQYPAEHRAEIFLHRRRK